MSKSTRQIIGGAQCDQGWIYLRWSMNIGNYDVATVLSGCKFAQYHQSLVLYMHECSRSDLFAKCALSQLSSSLFSEAIPCLAQPPHLPSMVPWEWIKRCLFPCGWGNLPVCPCSLQLGLHGSGNCSPALYRSSTTVKCKCCALGSYHSCI